MNGFLIVDKNSGMSSYDVIRRLKKISHFKKIGYIGTLDRNATGILPVAINEGVKVIQFFENQQKTYRADILLGTTTDTYDIMGKVLSSVTPEVFPVEEITNILDGYKGRILQEVPLFSSKKINRKPMYRLARQGIPLEPPKKEVEIFSIGLLGYEHPHIKIEVSCSKGTYIRSLAHDLGTTLGCGATLFSLKRTRHGDFTEDMAVNIDRINELKDIEDHLIPVEDVLKSFRHLVVEEPLLRFIKHGLPIPLAGSTREWTQGELVRLVSRKGMLIGIGMADTFTKAVKIKRLINI
ncbi:MAG: tRNA pseudouridine(55) synthase TruB [Syntrophorhabdaceae bacterium]|nr:tRNA pseudouridine(55) synthase TruB [Syntrophorhabdaceae bacterium]